MDLILPPHTADDNCETIELSDLAKESDSTEASVLQTKSSAKSNRLSIPGSLKPERTGELLYELFALYEYSFVFFRSLEVAFLFCDTVRC